jgi:hypothetical protein
MKVSVQFELPLPEGFEPYLQIIAKTHGWSEGSELTVNEYVCENVCKPQVSSLFSAIIANAISGYLGLSGSEQVKDILLAYNQLHTVTAEITE